jgi:formate--tetrahydrofolate ligase
MAVTITTMRPILDVAKDIGLEAQELRLYGPFMAKVTFDAIRRRRAWADGRVILVTAITPTPAGEGKTVTAIGLAQALRLKGERAIVCLREPSMGPVFGMKGGATGGGRSTVEPAGDIDLHFTGDLHAVTSANNLLAALIDEHLFRGRDPHLDVRRILFHRTLDINDRALRGVIVGLGGAVPREERFDITAASEVMALLGLARDYEDLRRRLGGIIAGVARDGKPVTADDLKATGAMAALLRDALLPNLVQTQESGPAFVHTGPFANIAHGTSSLISLSLGRKLADYVIVEAGFGADLGAEKFVDLVGSAGGPHPDVAVIVATARALKYHAGVAADRLADPNTAAVEAGLPMLKRHVDIVRRLRARPVVAVNIFDADAPQEVEAIIAACGAWNVPAAASRAFAAGGQGTTEVADLVRTMCVTAAPPAGPIYPPNAPLQEKIERIAREIYGASEVAFSDLARRRLREAEAWGFGTLPVCMAKTQYSLTDQPQVRGTPGPFTLTIRDVSVRAGAGFVLVLAGEIMTMPALPVRPRAWDVDIDDAGGVTWQ